MKGYLQERRANGQKVDELVAPKEKKERAEHARVS